MPVDTLISDGPRTKQNQKSYKKESFPVLEMTCAACAVSVEHA